MLGFLNDIETPVSDSLLFGQYAMTNNVGGTGEINHCVISHCNARHIFVESDMTRMPVTIPPSDSTWNTTYIMNGDMAHETEGQIQAGNAGSILSNLTALLVRRKRRDVLGDKWITIFKIPVTSEFVDNGITFLVKDYFTRSGTQYEYALIPLIQRGTEIVQGAELADDPSEPTHVSATPNFDSIFVCGRDEAMRLYATMGYDDLTRVQLTGIHETLGNQYPIVVANSNVNYLTSGVSATVLDATFLDSMTAGGNAQLDRQELRKARDEIMTFLTDKKPKIIKDMNGNMWLTMITDTPTYSFVSSWGMGIGDVHFSWTEIGDVDNDDDLDAAGMIGGINTEE